MVRVPSFGTINKGFQGYGSLLHFVVYQFVHPFCLLKRENCIESCKDFSIWLKSFQLSLQWNYCPIILHFPLPVLCALSCDQNIFQLRREQRQVEYIIANRLSKLFTENFTETERWNQQLNLGNNLEDYGYTNINIKSEGFPGYKSPCYTNCIHNAFQLKGITDSSGT